MNLCGPTSSRGLKKVKILSWLVTGGGVRRDLKRDLKGQETNGVQNSVTKMPLDGPGRTFLRALVKPFSRGSVAQGIFIIWSGMDARKVK
jgi:hypothetical protein